MPSILEFLRSQLLTEVPLPTKKFTGQTIIVTGSNTGLGLEATRHFVHLDAEKVILAVRNVAKGETAAASIRDSTGRKDVTEVWGLDLSSHASVKNFAHRVNTLQRLGAFVSNAGVMTYNFVRAETDDILITVNVVSTLMLGLLVLPKLRETSLRLHKETVLTFVNSLGHAQARFSERSSDHIFNDMATESSARMFDRYNVSKLIQLLLVRELAEKVTSSKKPGEITVSALNPGLAHSEVGRNVSFFHRKIINAVFGLVVRTSEEASRTLVLAAAGGQETHGQYLDDGNVGTPYDEKSLATYQKSYYRSLMPLTFANASEYRPSDFVTSEEGRMVQKQHWHELLDKLREIYPGIDGLI